jgi:hypothetical protein
MLLLVDQLAGRIVAADCVYSTYHIYCMYLQSHTTNKPLPQAPGHVVGMQV